MKGTFKITISPDGSKVGVDVGEATGTSCVELTRVFSKIGKNSISEKKAEFYIETLNSVTVGV